MSDPSSALATSWDRQPKPWAFVCRLVDQLCDESPTLSTWRNRLLRETGTRLIDWIDHLALGAGRVADDELQQLGFECRDDGAWFHPGGIFPLLKRPAPEISDGAPGLAMKVESVESFLSAHQLVEPLELYGRSGSSLRIAAIEHAPLALWVVQRHGNPGFESPQPTPDELSSIEPARERFRERMREGDPPERGFATAIAIFDRAAEHLGPDRTCDLFFATEREYWQGRNRVARIQYSRQQQLGLGWANHDHHTYRSSRECFAQLVGVLEHFGFVCRERFYAGAQSGWGAQVLEQPSCGLVVFADVDLSPEEVDGDFAHEGLAARAELGTVGLWCKLHGESFLEAGMHHLECQCDFDAAREQLASAGVKTMAPFTDFPFLRQAFTEGEYWRVAEQRLKELVDQQRISVAQAEEFSRHGAIGSHLEILERNEGYKGFNQTGVSDIICRTDPRRS